MSADGSAREPLFVLSSGRIDHGDNPRAVYLSPLTGDLTIGPRVDRGQPPNPFTVSPSDHWRVTDASIVDDDKDGSDELFLALFENIGRLLVIDPSEERAVWALESHNRNFISSVDLNGDGFADLLSSVGAFDIVNDALIWEPQPAVANETVEDAAGGDLNGDGVGEIVTIEGGAVVVYSRSTNEEDFTRSQIPHIISEATSWISDLLVSDTDGDGGAAIAHKFWSRMSEKTEAKHPGLLHSTPRRDVRSGNRRGCSGACYRRAFTTSNIPASPGWRSAQAKPCT